MSEGPTKAGLLNAAEHIEQCNRFSELHLHEPSVAWDMASEILQKLMYDPHQAMEIGNLLIEYAEYKLAESNKE